MRRRPPCDRDRRGSGLPEPAHCALLDRYWDDLQSRSGEDSRPRSLDRDFALPIAEVLDVPGALHRFRRALRAEVDGPPTPIARTTDPEGRTTDDSSGPTAVMPDQHGRSPVAGPPGRIGKYPLALPESLPCRDRARRADRIVNPPDRRAESRSGPGTVADRDRPTATSTAAPPPGPVRFVRSPELPRSDPRALAAPRRCRSASAAIPR
jgi:hypothetical protein